MSRIAWLPTIKVSPYIAIQYVTLLDMTVVAYVVCKGDLTVSDGKTFTDHGQAICYARGLVDGGWDGDVTIRYKYAEEE